MAFKKSNQNEHRIERLEARQVMTAVPVLGVLPTSIPSPELGVIDLQSDQFQGVGSGAVENISDQYGLIGLGQTVAIIDTGIAYDHYALGGGFGSDYRVVGGWDFAEGDADPYDDGPAGFHGTHVAGIVGSDDTQYTGVASGVDLVALRVFDDNGQGQFDWIESALDWVHENRFNFENPVTAVNMSIGADWNADTIPDWAMLEDELAQLEQDGIFISVSAGNDFYSEQVAGLNYPAVSQHVVPVASHGSDGTLSGFSQRSERVIVAPGERVTSTAPDYLFGFDGVTDDYLASSGTSMAAPFVAGASTLVREAMRLAGEASVNQADIYNHLRATADTVYDSVTDAYYDRLNLERAIEAALPADDYGDSLGAAHSIGTLNSSRNLSGLFTTKQDQDYFQFTAGESGTVTISASGAEYADARVRLVSQTNSPALGQSELEFSVTAGQSYAVAFETAAGIGHYGALLELAARSVVTDMGVVDVANWRQSALPDQTASQSFTAANDGWLSISGSGAQSGTIELADSHGNVVGQSTYAGGKAQIRVEVARGDRFTLRSSDTNAGTQIRMTNVVAFDGRAIELFATASRDVFVVSAGRSVTVSVNGENYVLGGGDYSTVQLNGASQSDEIWVFGTNGDDSAVVWNDSAQLTGDGYHVSFQGTTQYSLIGRAGNDSVTIYDTPGDDVFVGRRNYALLSGNGVRHLAAGFESVEARSAQGGRDLALLYDSAGDDHLELSAVAGSLSYADGAATEINGFDNVQVVANQGGNDSADFSGSSATDRFIGRPDASYFEGVGFSHFARGFDDVRIFAGSGQGTALVYDSAGNDRLTMSASATRMEGTFFSIELHEFDALTALATAGGDDLAIIQDTAGNDTFIGLGKLNILQGDGFRHVASGFESTAATASSGNDVSILYASTDGNDTLHTGGDRTTLTSDLYTTSVSSFDSVVIVGPTLSVEPATVGTTGKLQRPALFPHLAYVTGDPVLQLAMAQFNSQESDVAAADNLEQGAQAVSSDSSYQPQRWAVDSAVRDHSLTARATVADAVVINDLDAELQITEEAFVQL